jgi:hypothetical protein
MEICTLLNKDFGETVPGENDSMDYQTKVHPSKADAELPITNNE